MSHSYSFVNDGPGGPRPESGNAIWKATLMPTNQTYQIQGRLSALVEQGINSHITDNDALAGELAVYRDTPNNGEMPSASVALLPRISTNPKQVGILIARTVAAMYPDACEWAALAGSSYAGVVGGAGISVLNPPTMEMGTQMKRGLISIMNSVQFCQRSYAGMRIRLALPIQKAILRTPAAGGGTPTYIAGDLAYSGSPCEDGVDASKIRYVTREVSPGNFARALTQQVQMAANSPDAYNAILASMNMLQRDSWNGATLAIMHSAQGFALSFMRALIEQKTIEFTKLGADMLDTETSGLAAALTTDMANDTGGYGVALLAQMLGCKTAQRYRDGTHPADRKTIEDNIKAVRTNTLRQMFPLDDAVDLAGTSNTVRVAGLPDEAYAYDVKGNPRDGPMGDFAELQAAALSDMIYAQAQVGAFQSSFDVGITEIPSTFGHKHQVLTY